jgi:hypothetical protein
MATLAYIAAYTATDLNKAGGKVLDHASQGAVEITRRSARFVLMREDHLARLLDAARTGRPQSLADLLRDYDVAKVKSLTRSFTDDKPAGRELL